MNQSLNKQESVTLALDQMDAALWRARSAAVRTSDHHIQIGHAIDAFSRLKKALAQTEQEPFGHVTVRRLSQRFENHHDQFQFYPAGQSPYLDNVDECYAVYTTPPQRTWVGLTDEEVITMSRYDLEYAALIGEVERKLKEKNT